MIGKKQMTRREGKWKMQRSLRQQGSCLLLACLTSLTICWKVGSSRSWTERYIGTSSGKRLLLRWWGMVSHRPESAKDHRITCHPPSALHYPPPRSNKSRTMGPRAPSRNLGRCCRVCRRWGFSCLSPLQSPQGKLRSLDYPTKGLGALVSRGPHSSPGKAPVCFSQRCTPEFACPFTLLKGHLRSLDVLTGGIYTTSPSLHYHFQRLCQRPG